jgi:hypothetical protein
MKKITLAGGLLLYLFSGKTQAQFTSVWTAAYQHTTSSGYSNEGRKVAEDPSGNIFILSDNTSDIDLNGVQGTNTYHYVTVAKYSTTGSLLNSLVIDVYNHATSGFDNPGAFGLEVDAAGDVYLGYTTWDAVSGYDIVLEKYDNNLSNMWINFYVTQFDDLGIDFKLHSSGTIYALVKSSGIQTTYSVIESVPLSVPPNLIYSFPGAFVGLNSIALDGNQIVYAGGYSLKAGYKNAYLSAIDVTTHSILWGTIYTPRNYLGDDEINQVTVGVDGNIYSIGTSWQGPNGNQAVVLKNSPGNKKFDFIEFMSAGGIGMYGLFIDASESGWVYIGAVDETDPKAYIFRIPDDGIYNAPGTIGFAPVPVSAYTNVNSLKLTDMKVSSNSRVYITGSINSTGPSGDFTCSFLSKTFVVFGNALIDGGSFSVDGDVNSNYEGVGLSLDYSKDDVYWIRNSWDDLHNSEVVELLDVNVPAPLRKAADTFVTDISVSPNPATTYIDIKSDEVFNSLEITDLRGSRLSMENFSGEELRVDISGLSPGIYLVRATSAEGNEMIKKIVVN